MGACVSRQSGQRPTITVEPISSSHEETIQEKGTKSNDMELSPEPAIKRIRISGEFAGDVGTDGTSAGSLGKSTSSTFPVEPPDQVGTLVKRLSHNSGKFAVIVRSDSGGKRSSESSQGKISQGRHSQARLSVSSDHRRRSSSRKRGSGSSIRLSGSGVFSGFGSKNSQLGALDTSQRSHSVDERGRDGPLRYSNVATDHSEENYVNEYTFVDDLGEGSSGDVKLAVHEGDGEYYAVKIMSKKRQGRRQSLSRGGSSRGGGGSGNLAMINQQHREVAVLKKLDHPNVVNLYEVIDDPAIDQLYLVFEYVENGVIMDPEEDGSMTSFPEEEVRSFMQDAVGGLAYVHAQGIVHGDIKPQNLFITATGRVKIGDFGVSYLQTEENKRMKAGQGTPIFMAPEVITSRKRSFTGSRTMTGTGSETSLLSVEDTIPPLEQDIPFNPYMVDIWALGITIYMLIYGFPPFRGRNVFELYSRIAEEELVFPEEPDVSDSLKEMLFMMLEKSPVERLSIEEIKEHPWLTADGKYIWDEEAVKLVEVSNEEIHNAVRRVPFFSKEGAKIFAEKIRRSVSQRGHSMNLSRNSKPHVRLDAPSAGVSLGRRQSVDVGLSGSIKITNARRKSLFSGLMESSAAAATAAHIDNDTKTSQDQQ